MRPTPGCAVEYPDARCELDHRNAYELLAATILSAQCTDARVNMVTPALFAAVPDARRPGPRRPADVEELIRSTGFYKNKTRSLLGMADALVTRFGGEVPHRMADLVTIPGVGRKTANVVRSVALGEPGLPVDTHVTRLSRLLGLTTETDAGEDRAGAEHDGAGRRAGAVLAAAHPARSTGLHRPATPLRRVRAARLLSLVDRVTERPSVAAAAGRAQPE